MNKWIGHGRLVREPDLRYTSKGTPVCNMTIAVTDGFGKYENTEFIKVVVWGKKGKAAAQHLHKASQVLVEGKLTIRKTEKGGNKYTNPEIVASNVKFIYGSKSKNESEDNNNIEEYNPENDTEDVPEEDDFEVPF